MKLPFGRLFLAPGLAAGADHAALFFARIASEEVMFFENGFEVLVNFDQSTSKAVGDGADLAHGAGALDFDGSFETVEGVGDFERFEIMFFCVRKAEVGLDRLIVYGDIDFFVGFCFGIEADASDGSFAAANRVGVFGFFGRWF